MKHLTKLVQIILFTCMIGTINAQTTYYVDQSATGLNDGSSWLNAFTDFQSTLGVASFGNIILVAEGVYKPTSGTNRQIYFNLVDGVSYYGGFPPGGGTMADRDFVNHASVLSGDIGVPNDSTDNSFHVVYSEYVSILSGTKMSGFTIESGNANGTAGTPNGQGAGIYCSGFGDGIRLDTVTIQNNFGWTGAGMYGGWFTEMYGCTFQNNVGGDQGGAICLIGNASMPIFYNTAFINNIAGEGGAIYANNSVDMFLHNCSFTSNVANGGFDLAGGAVYCKSGTHEFYNCTFDSNTAGFYGGAIYGRNILVDGCNFIGNYTDGPMSESGGAIFYTGTGNLIIRNSIFWQNTSLVSGSGGAIFHTGTGTLDIVNSSFYGNSVPGPVWLGGALSTDVPATITNCIFWGNIAGGNDLFPESEIYGSTITVSNSIWQGNTSGGSILNEDPLFVDPSNGDFNLLPCSPAIDFGTSSGAPTVDFFNNPRPIDGDGSAGAQHDLGAIEMQSILLTSDIDIKGNNTEILNGSSSPTNADYTLFDTINSCALTTSRTYKIYNSGTGNLNLGSPSISGTNATDFSITSIPSSSVTPGDSTFITIEFDPAIDGTSDATLSIPNDDCIDSDFTFAIRGVREDTTPPVALCHDTTVYVEFSFGVSITPDMIDAGSTDDCANYTLLINGGPYENYFCSNLGSQVATLYIIDENWNVDVCDATVTILDTLAPVPDVAVLSNVIAECSASLIAPTATDQCLGTITATTMDPTTYASEGNYTIAWEFDDGNGNIAIQTQNVIIDDVTAPVPTISNLPDLSGCEVSVSSIPTAMDNCIGTITATTNDPLFYNTIGTYSITWTYDDSNGNTTIQTQNIIVEDNEAPVPDISLLPDLTGCEVTVSTIPTATDNCAGAIDATTTDPLVYNSIGTYTVTWSYDDSNGNTSTQTQTVIVEDNEAPVPDSVSLPDLEGCEVVVGTTPSATDNCNGTITGITSDPLSYSNVGNYTLTWNYDDGNGNISTQTQNITVLDCSSIEELEILHVTVFPNPTNAEFVVQINDYSGEELNYTITDLLGGVVESGILKEELQSFNLDYVESGIYHLKILGSKGMAIETIVVN